MQCVWIFYEPLLVGAIGFDYNCIFLNYHYKYAQSCSKYRWMFLMVSDHRAAAADPESRGRITKLGTTRTARDNSSWNCDVWQKCATFRDTVGTEHAGCSKGTWWRILALLLENCAHECTRWISLTAAKKYNPDNHWKLKDGVLFPLSRTVVTVKGNFESFKIVAIIFFFCNCALFQSSLNLVSFVSKCNRVTHCLS